MPKINDYPAATELSSSDLFLVDGSDGTRKITADNMVGSVNNLQCAMQHRNILDVRSLGTTTASITAFKDSISSQTFDGLYTGNYWTVNGFQWDIVDIQYYYRTGSTYSFTTPHIVIMPATRLYAASMNSSNTTEGAYVGSEMYESGLDEAKSIIEDTFGDMLLTHEVYLPNATTDGAESGGAWLDSTVELPDECNIYGCKMRTATYFNRYIASVDYSQFALFALSHDKIITTGSRYAYWTRNVYSSANFCRVTDAGNANNTAASASGGVRPVFCIG